MALNEDDGANNAMNFIVSAESFLKSVIASRELCLAGNGFCLFFRSFHTMMEVIESFHPQGEVISVTMTEVREKVLDFPIRRFEILIVIFSSRYLLKYNT